MIKSNNSVHLISCALFITGSCHCMGLRSFVALPVEKGGAVMRIAFEHARATDTDSLTLGLAYGFSANQTLLLGLPYRLSPAGDDRQSDVSVLYRHIVWRKDSSSGTDRLGLLGGAIVPTENDRETSTQAGFVFTHYKNRHEVDIDGLYQAGMESHAASGRYDISWQYRLLPAEYPNWGIPQEVNTVLELNGRWHTRSNMTHQLTTGLQWIHPRLVIEGGLVKDINNDKEVRYLISTRFHY